MSCSAKPTTTAPTADVANTFSPRTTIATTANSDDDDRVLHDGREVLGHAVDAQRVDRDEHQQVDGGQRLEQDLDAAPLFDDVRREVAEGQPEPDDEAEGDEQDRHHQAPLDQAVRRGGSHHGGDRQDQRVGDERGGNRSE